MTILGNMLQRIADRLNKSVQGDTPAQRYRDYYAKGEDYSVESEISETLADLMLMLSSTPISGESERAKWLDDLSDRFFQTKAKKTVSVAFGTGDCIVVPSWNGRNIQNIVVSSDDFVVLETQGDEITACAYLIETREVKSEIYRLYQAIELVPYTTESGEQTFANRYRIFVARNDSLVSGDLSKFKDWQSRYDNEWYIPNVERLLIGRMKSQTIAPKNLNSVKGVPICFGAGKHIKELHYLLDQMHSEFGLSEKAIMADKRMFQKEWGRDGESYAVLPRGKERLFVQVKGIKDNQPFEEWSPEIRYEAYLKDIDKQERLIEHTVGVSSGILSEPNDVNYQNVDNVRKSQQKTMAFINGARQNMQDCMNDLIYAWNVLANYFDINAIGEYEVSFDWSNEYVETFSDRQNAILAGEAIGATDAVDYRMFVMEESPEAAKKRVEEIQAAKKASMTIEEIGNE